MNVDLRGRDFTPRGVYVGTTRLLDEVVQDRSLDMVVVDRYSVADGTGIHRQVQATKLMFGEHQDTATYATIDPTVFDPDPQHRSRMEHSIARQGHVGRLVLKKDLWPTERSEEVVGAIVCVGRTLFLRIESSGSKRNIRNIAGTDLNAYSLLVKSTTMHLDGPVLTRWSDDVHRAGRDALAMKDLVDAHKDRGKRMQFGLNEFDPQNSLDSMLLALLSEMGEQDNEARAIKMFGAKSSQYFSGRVPIAESRLPHGVFHKRETRETLRGTEYVLANDSSGRIPIWDARYEAPIAAAVELHADGHSYVDIGLALAEYDVERRSTSDARYPTFRAIALAQDLSRAEKRAELSAAAKSFLAPRGGRKGNWVPLPDHPNYDPELTALLHSKLLLWETGYWYTQLHIGALRGFGRTVKGHKLRYDNENPNGWILVPAPLFVDEDGSPTINVGLEAHIWSASRERLASEKMRRVTTGGAAHTRLHGRILNPNTWYDGDFDPLTPPRGPSGQLVDDGTRQYRAATRSQGQGSRLNRVLRTRPAVKSVKSDQDGGERGWGSSEGEILATFNDGELCHEISTVAELALVNVVDQLEPVELLPGSATLDTPSEEVDLRRVEELISTIDELERDFKAFRREAARRALHLEEATPDTSPDVRRQLEEALELARTDEMQVHQEIIERRRQLHTLESEATTPRASATQADNGPEVEVATDLGEIAWWIAGLRRTTDGTGPAAMAEVTARVLSDWRFAVSADASEVEWSCDLVWPEQSGRNLRQALHGTVPNRRKHRRPRGGSG